MTKATLTADTLTLGIDLGTHAVKVAAIDATGTVAGTGQAAFTTVAELPGQSEQAPEDWLQAAAEAIADLGQQLGGGWTSRLAGIGLTGQLPTLVCMGQAGVLGSAITWSDARADDWAANYLSPERRDWLYRRTGMPIDGRYLAPMLAYHRGAVISQVTGILSAKDFLCAALTGRSVTDPSTAAGYGVYDLTRESWDKDLCTFWKLNPNLLPAVQPAHEIAGRLQAETAQRLGLPAGLPVGVGAADSVCGALAMGGLTPGVVSIAMGSSTIVLDAIRQPLLDERIRYLLTPHVAGGWYGREMDLLSTGIGYRWLGDMLGLTGEALAVEAAKAPPGAHGLLFAPYLAGGEQGALWNPDLRGALVGLTVQHTRTDIARAFLEGVCFEIRRCVEILADQSRIDRVVLAGHMAAHPASLAMLADVLQRPVQPFAHLSPAAWGAARLAQAGLDASTDLSHPASATEPGATVIPGGDAATYAALYESYKARFPMAALPFSDITPQRPTA